MKRLGMLVLLMMLAALGASAQARWSFKGTVARMRTRECTSRGFMAAMSGGPATVARCQEYTILSDKVVYVVVANHGTVFMPLAEDIDFIVTRSELIVLSEDEKTRSRFSIEQMTLRVEWEREETRREMAAKMMERGLERSSGSPAHPVLVQRAER